MFKSILKDKSLKKKLLISLLLLFVTRIGTQIPLPFIDHEMYKMWFQNILGDNGGFINAFTGGSLENMSIFSLSITPYITASIILQLLIVAIPLLEDIQKDGKAGEEKIKKITIGLAIGLAFIESIAMSIGFYHQNLLSDKIPYGISICIISLILVLSSILLIVIGEKITKIGLGNGTSLILTFNILSRIPNDFHNLMNQFIINQSSVFLSIFDGLIILSIIVSIIVFIIIMNGGVHKIPIKYSNKITNNKVSQASNSSLDLKVNMAGVVPIIFASSLLQFPIVISQFIGKTPEFMNYLNSSYWFNLSNMKYTIGYLLYILLMLFFTYFYTYITFNTKTIANNIKHSGGTIPGIRPGKPTQDYIDEINKYLIFIGFSMMFVLATIPFIINGFFKTNVSFGGTSLIIVICVLLETHDKIKSFTLNHTYRNFIFG